MKKRSSKTIFLLTFLSILAGSDGFAAKGVITGGGKHNNKAPIEVTSDALEVLQTDNKAIFTGHVVAIQGDVRLTADKMTVFYESADEKKADKTKKPDKKSDQKDAQKDTGAKKPKKDDKGSDNPQGAIKRIEPEGNVFLTTPEETASGATGVYDVEHQEIHLNDHVILTRGKNVLKGDKLVYNFATGKSVVTSGSSTSTAGAKGKERVHALFVPEDKKPEAKHTNQKESDDKDQSSQ